MKRALPLITLLLTSFCLFAQTPASPDLSAAKGAESKPVVQNQPAPDIFPRWSVVGEWRVTHPFWTDVLSLRADGTLITTRQGTTGRWTLTADAGTPLLVIRWDMFGTESLSMVSQDHFRGQPRRGLYSDMRRRGESAAEHAPDGKR